MLNKKQAHLIKKLNADIPKGADMFFDKAILKNICNPKLSIDYVALSGEIKTLPLCEEDYRYLMVESDMPRFYARRFVDGERLLLLYNSCTKEMAREIELPYPCRMLNNAKCYFMKYLSQNVKIPPEQDYTLIWEVQNKT